MAGQRSTMTGWNWQPEWWRERVRTTTRMTWRWHKARPKIKEAAAEERTRATVSECGKREAWEKDDFLKKKAVASATEAGEESEDFCHKSTGERVEWRTQCYINSLHDAKLNWSDKMSGKGCTNWYFTHWGNDNKGTKLMSFLAWGNGIEYMMAKIQISTVFFLQSNQSPNTQPLLLPKCIFFYLKLQYFSQLAITPYAEKVKLDCSITEGHVAEELICLKRERNLPYFLKKKNSPYWNNCPCTNSGQGQRVCETLMVHSWTVALASNEPCRLYSCTTTMVVTMVHCMRCLLPWELAEKW